MITGLIMIGIAWIIFIILSEICLFTNHKKEWIEFELDDISDLHIGKRFWNDTVQFIFRTVLAISFCLFAAGIVVFSLNCFPEWGLTWDKVFLRLFAAFFGGIIAGWILKVLGNIIAVAIPFTGLTIWYLIAMPIEWLRGRE